MDIINKENNTNIPPRRVNTPSVPPPPLTNTPLKVFDNNSNSCNNTPIVKKTLYSNTKRTFEALDKATVSSTIKMDQNAISKPSTPGRNTNVKDNNNNNKKILISNYDVVQVLMKGSQPLEPGTPAKVVKTNDETWLVRTDDGGVYRVDAKNLKAVENGKEEINTTETTSRNVENNNDNTVVFPNNQGKIVEKNNINSIKDDEQKDGENVNQDNNDIQSTSTVPTITRLREGQQMVEEAIMLMSNNNENLNQELQALTENTNDAMAGLEFSLLMGLKPDPSLYEHLTVEQIREKLTETYQTLFAAIEIGTNDQLPRLTETVKCLTSRLEELGYPQPSKLSAQITMTRAQIQVAVKEKKFEKCSTFQDKLDELIAHDTWIRDATKDITYALRKQKELSEKLNDAIEKKEWSKCTSLKAEVETIDKIISMVKLENCLTEEDIEKQIAQVEADIGKSVKDGNYGACEVLNRKLESLHIARDLARKSNQMDKDVDASFEMVEQDILQTRERAAELNGSTNTLKTPVGGQMNQSNNATDGNIQNEMGRLSPSNLRAHNQEFNLARFGNIPNTNEYNHQNNDDAQSSISNFTSVSTYDNNKFVFKITDNEGNTHRFRNFINRFDALVRKCASRIGLAEGTFKLRYKDEEGDMVVLMDDDDVQEAVEATRNRPTDNKFVRLTYTMLVVNQQQQQQQQQQQHKQLDENDEEEEEEEEEQDDEIQLETNAQRQLNLNDSSDYGDEEQRNTKLNNESFPFPENIDNDCIVERIPIVKRVLSSKKKKNIISADSEEDEDESSEEEEDDDEEEEESSDDESSDEDDISEKDFDKNSVEEEQEEQEEEEYEMILKDKSNWINESTAAFSKNLKSGMPSFDEPVTIAIASGVAVLGLLFLFKRN